ncbi:ABC transporter substrate-binding protein [Herbaspirillum sp. DW155]|uniref:hypothetical protein n=1 Tax=Herbaspirillum sp. DW155 TaxID=3095609 RepID=UPI00309035A7|nr:ABC transporter substrate-binding protein [Herbaspirillum sp. DW155]
MSRDKTSARSVAAAVLVLAMSLFCAASTRAHTTAANAPVIEIKLADLNDDNPVIDYRKALLELAMRASGRPFVIKGCQVANVATSDQRYVQLIQGGQYCNLMATSAGSGMTRTLEAIPFPIYLGGGGYRVLLARRASLERAGSIRSLDELRTFTIGSGIGWLDTSIMQANQLKVAQGNYMSLFEMLKAGRFDFYNRSIFEAASELDAYDPRHQLAIVPDLVLYYPTDLFFYTTPGRDDIREALLDGLRKIHRNGALLELIQKHHSTRHVRLALQGAHPRVIVLQNDRLTPSERLAIETYKMDWFK